MFVDKLFTYLACKYLKIKRCFNMKSSTYYFHKKTKILADFQICISVPLILIHSSRAVNPYYEYISSYWERKCNQFLFCFISFDVFYEI